MTVNDNLEAATSIDPIIWRVAAVAALGPFMTQMDSTVVTSRSRRFEKSCTRR
jgi:hypothetical protein